MTNEALDYLDSPLGRIWISTRDDTLTKVEFDSELISDSDRADRCSSHYGQLVCEQLKEYFFQKRQTFELKLAPIGTQFQREVWWALLKIPYGRTLSYADQSALVKRPNAVRAVANANGANPIPIIIPCHRVIAKSGGLGGYSPGIDKKEWLLKHERDND